MMLRGYVRLLCWLRHGAGFECNILPFGHGLFHSPGQRFYVVIVDGFRVKRPDLPSYTRVPRCLSIGVGSITLILGQQGSGFGPDDLQLGVELGFGCSLCKV